MKSIVLIFGFVFLTQSLMCKVIPSKNDCRIIPDSIIVEQLKSVTFEEYIGKPFGEFIENDTIRKFQEYSFDDINPNVLAGVVLWYSDNITITVYISGIRYQDYLAPAELWSFELLRKETISGIRLRFGNKEIKKASKSNQQ